MNDDLDSLPSPPPPRWRAAVLVVLVALGPVLRLALAAAALTAVGMGAERFHDGAGYLVVGALVWLELSLARRRGGSDAGE